MSDSTMLPCACCEGVGRETPAVIFNRPALSQIAYRVGTHASFKASLLASLTDPNYPGVAPLTTRDASDFSIALLDAFAVSADVLTFYQERLANESYLRTAVQPRSVFELARLVGYQPSPGVAASTPLAVTLNDAQGAPDPAVIPAGTRVQSVPPPGQSPAVFETSTDLVARIAHNAIPPIQAQPVAWQTISTSLWLAGTATGLKPGDAILLVDAARVTDPASEVWEFRTVTAVTTDSPGNRTRIEWDVGLFRYFQSNATDVQICALRRRASLFGVNAPDPQTLKNVLTNPPVNDWTFIHDTKHIDLDTTYTGLAPLAVPDPTVFDSAPERFSWVVLSSGTERRLYAILAAADRAPVRYTLAAKATGLSLDTDDGLPWFVAHTRQTTVFIGSEPLTIVSQPLLDWPNTPPALGPGMLRPVAGTAETVTGGGWLVSGQTLAVLGKRARLQLASGATATLVGADGSTPIPFLPGDVVVADAYPPETLASGMTVWQVLTTQGVAATLTATPTALVLLPADKADATVSEAVVLDTVTPSNAGQTSLTFSHTPSRIYDRATVQFNANVVNATHGETVQEILGSADASQPNQTFVLKQSPLTYLSAPQGQGAVSTLQVWVNDLRWQELPSLLNASARERVYSTRVQSGSVTVQFGDGTLGARPPSGQTNVRAAYRKGLGLVGNVPTGGISQAIDRPAGLKVVMNPTDATGGADPDTPADTRTSAPLHVLTLERVVSLQDYQDFSRAFAGVARALATWTWSGLTRGVVVTVAGPGGAALDPDGETIGNLAASLRASGNPYIPVTVLPANQQLFRIAGLVRIDTENYDQTLVLAAVRTALIATFGFDARGLGQGVVQSEVIAAIQAVPGVQASRLSLFTRSDIPIVLPDFLAAAAPQTGARGTLTGAEMLLIDPLSLTGLGPWP
jgi:hypothetical protein